MSRSSRREPACALVREALSALRDREAPPIPAELAEEHLVRCEGCRAFVARLDVLDALVAPAVRPLHGLEEPVVAAPGRRDCPRQLGRWAAAFLPLAFAGGAFASGLAAPAATRPTRPATPCTVGLAAAHVAGRSAAATLSRSGRR